jgi:hypothetical protein
MATTPATRLATVVVRWLVADHDAQGVAEGLLANGGVLTERREDLEALFNRLAAAAREVAVTLEVMA